MKRTDMYGDGRYLEKNPEWNGEDAPWKTAVIHELLTRNKIDFKSVVDLGCGSGRILDGLSRLYPAVTEWRGYDISADAINLSRQLENNRLSFHNSDFLNSSQHTDLLLNIDVVEHVADYYGFLEQMKNKATYFIFHIPLDLCCISLLKPHILLQQRDDVGHVHYFSKEMVLWMLKDTGYQIIDFSYTKPLLDTLPQDRPKQKIKKILRKAAFAIDTEKSIRLFGGYSMMILAK